jgi:tetrahydrodipicolinate N-succinyltransferase
MGTGVLVGVFVGIGVNVGTGVSVGTGTVVGTGVAVGGVCKVPHPVMHTNKISDRESSVKRLFFIVPLLFGNIIKIGYS